MRNSLRHKILRVGESQSVCEFGTSFRAPAVSYEGFLLGTVQIVAEGVIGDIIFKGGIVHIVKVLSTLFDGSEFC
jgi:hypothetical protein